MSKRKKAGKEAPQQKGDELVAIPLELDWHIPENVSTHYASSTILQIIDKNHFKIMFFDTQLPIELKGKTLVSLEKSSKKAQAKCVSSTVVTTQHLRTIVDLFNKQLKVQSQFPKDAVAEKPDK